MIVEHANQFNKQINCLDEQGMFFQFYLLLKKSVMKMIIIKHAIQPSVLQL